jgi:3-hydroxyisobutyrate dehydrogenase-like beta-hydroxyacid dehydrogenase
MSTLPPAYCIKVAEGASEKGVAVLDCPVSGGNIGAEKGTLALILGGDIEAMERCRAELEVMGTIYYCGDVGMGQVAKLANNAIAFTTAAVVGEACAMARAYGMDIDKLIEILTKSTGQSFITNHWDYVTSEWPHLRDLGKKDAGLCIDTAQAKDIAVPLIAMRYGQDWTVDPSQF